MRRTSSRSQRRILTAILEAPVAWMTVEAIANAARLSLDDTNDGLADLEIDGWIDLWEPEGELSITLSTLGAERLGVELTEPSLDGRQRWVSRDEAENAPVRTKKTMLGDPDFDFFDTIPDPSPSPDVAAEIGERIEELSDRDCTPAAKLPAHGFPRPTILLGLSSVPWPRATDAGKARTCPVCGTKPLDPRAYCLWCDRWGMDALLYRRSPDRVPPNSPPGLLVRPRPTASKSDRAELEREIRKDRRKRKHAERWETQTPRRARTKSPRATR
ncbi:MAG: hypothetical protein SFX72_17900 [Isosphaeraceae bacterium]|nr:hypothetical protein [Isosphaeraceae bacterium]